ncbi:MAG: PepSY domain-containing protein [Gemmatimonadota bacterium]|nr:PepSY domain-containing protein [Gemmatimonadota bacterium]MDH4350099.1 PepSY domain-containing protein [Gemmatimonadota bacterium]MDH5197539.1 PepSY domain-containing protein [Gemmatimonadota bacterium]
MTWQRKTIWYAFSLFVVLGLSATPALAQGKSKANKSKDSGHSAVSVEMALSATKDVLVAQGFEVLRIEVQDGKQIVHYRAGNQGRGKGHGPPLRMVIQRTDDRIVVLDAPDEIKLEIGVKLGIKL